jgi:transposase
LAAELEARLEAHPLAEVLTSMPSNGFRTALKILTIVGDAAAFPTAGHLAAYAGLAPVTRRSGSSIKGETRSQRGNHALKSALFLSAFASLADPTSRAYYDRKVRHEALDVRVEVRDLRLPAVAAAGVKLGAAVRRDVARDE